MADVPQTEMQDTTHMYMARVWYHDTQTLYLLGAFVFLVIQDKEFMANFPLWVHQIADKLIILGAIWTRFQSGTRPVAFQSGQAREVRSIAPAPQKVADGTP